MGYSNANNWLLYWFDSLYIRLYRLLKRWIECWILWDNWLSLLNFPPNWPYWAFEVYLKRVKKSLNNKMKVQWNTILSVEYLSKINCLATLDELQYHTNWFTQIMINASNLETEVPLHDFLFSLPIF